MKLRWHWKIKMYLIMDDINVEWLDQKSPINHMFKGFGLIDLLFPQLTFLNPIFGTELLEEKISQRKIIHS
jgi:hypothetical protein